MDVKRERESKSYQRTLRGGKGSGELPVDVKGEGVRGVSSRRQEGGVCPGSCQSTLMGGWGSAGVEGYQ